MQKLSVFVLISSILIIVFLCLNSGIIHSTGPCNPCKIFATNSYYSGNLNSIIGGIDNACDKDINKPDDGKIYKVIYMLAGKRDLNSDWVLHPNTTYQRTDLLTIGVTDSAGKLMTFSSSITDTGDGFWTGMNFDWTPDSINNCSGFTNDSAGYANWGRGNFSTMFAFSYDSWPCFDKLNLYCVEQ